MYKVMYMAGSYDAIHTTLAKRIEDIKKIQREKFPDRVGQGSAAKPDMPQPPVPTQMKGAAPVNQNNIVDLRNRT